MSSSFRCRRQPRRGAILFVVVACLALFLSLGIAFVFYANQQAISMRYHREASQGGRAANVTDVTRGSTDDEPPDASSLVNFALGQFIYDLPDNGTGVYSGMRGASLARGVFGGYYPEAPNSTSITYSTNTVPFNGIGKLHTPASGANVDIPAALYNAVPTPLRDAFKIVNYTYHSTDNFIFDPERIGFRSSTPGVQAYQKTSWTVNGANTTKNYFPINAGYTYPDEKDIYLASVDPVTGKVQVPSFYRPWLFGSLAVANPNWNNSIGKYMITRPRPADHVFNGTMDFPYPQTFDGINFGDVEQLEGKQVRQYDSLWTDLDLPVRKWRGRSYKPLVAFLVVDLDGRINMNVAGHFRNNSQASLQGWGPWETSFQPLLTGGNTETQFFANAAGRYGTSTNPQRLVKLDATGTNSAPVIQTPPYYGSVDWDGQGAGQMTLPAINTVETSPVFPLGAGGRFGNGSVAERLNHPLLYNPYLISNSLTTNRVLSPFDMYAMNHKFNGDASTYATSTLGTIYASSFGSNSAPGSLNARFAATTISNDYDRVGLSPWLHNVAPNAAGRYTLTQAVATPYAFPGQPSRPQTAFPLLTTRAQAPAAAGGTIVNDFDAQWKSIQAAMGAIDLNRKLADYRVNPNAAYGPANISGASYARALNERQIFAKDIFDRLCTAVGADNSTANLLAAPPTELNGLRWLAQLAVNIVDFIDNDDYITPFVWNPIGGVFSWNVANGAPSNAANFAAGTLGNHVVFGTELPRLVINEAAMSVENGTVANGNDHDANMVPPPPKGNQSRPHATFYIAKTWVELLNPLTTNGQSATSLSHSGGAAVRVNNKDAYRLLLTKPNNTLWKVDNVSGTPDGAIVSTVSLSGDTDHPAAGGVEVIPPSITSPPAYGSVATRVGSQFCVVGPGNIPGTNTLPGVNRNNFVAGNNTSMKFHIVPTALNNAAGTALINNGAAAFTTVLLQRVTCPDMLGAAGVDQTLANQFITTDYVEFNSFGPGNMIMDNRTRTQSPAANTPGVVLTPTGPQRSYGKMQPYAGDISNFMPQNPTPAPAAVAPYTVPIGQTFFRHNGRGATIAAAGNTLTQPFTWLAHLDRELVSPIELFNVSGCKPTELTHLFASGYTANWHNSNMRIYRALALLETGNRTLGLGTGGRVPGKVNINTVRHEAVLRAIADANVGGNHFTATDVTTIFNTLLTSRDGGLVGPSGNNSPFQSLGTPDSTAGTQYPTGMGFDKTILRPGGAGNLFDVPGQAHPYLTNELLNKIFNNLTTRSNTFAVYMTIGYFEVRNSGPYTDANRPKLGKELGTDDGTNIRHRFYSIIDRTNLTQDSATPRLQGTPPVYFSYEPVLQANNVDPAMPGPQNPAPVTVQALIPATSFSGGVLRGVYDGRAWQMSNGQKLTIDIGPAAAPTRQEVVTVTNISFAGATNGATITFQCTQPHARGCVMMMGTSIPGNPGPQSGFNYKDPRYSGVVPVVVQIN